MVHSTSEHDAAPRNGFSVQQASRVLGVSPDTVRNLIRGGHLIAYKANPAAIRPTYRVAADEVERYKRRASTEPQPRPVRQPRRRPTREWY
jgi:excisionase family DNA binding protein